MFTPCSIRRTLKFLSNLPTLTGRRFTAPLHNDATLSRGPLLRGKDLSRSRTAHLLALSGISGGIGFGASTVTLCRLDVTVARPTRDSVASRFSEDCRLFNATPSRATLEQVTYQSLLFLVSSISLLPVLSRLYLLSAMSDAFRSTPKQTCAGTFKRSSRPPLTTNRS